MYNIIESFINHTWVSNYSGDQTYIYAFSIIVGIVLVVTVVDLISRLFGRFIK